MEQMETDYFDAYKDFEIHKLMLQDAPRNKAFKEAIMDNHTSIKDKVVLDVGAGTGILSIFCAQAGAAKVYAVEASDVWHIMAETIKENGFEDKIHIINKRVEDTTLQDINGCKVDILVSEWMGFYLLHEGMLDSVIYARDNFLNTGGLIFPEFATLYTAPCSIPLLHDYWDNVEGVSMKSFGRKLRLKAAENPETIYINQDGILAEPEVIVWLDLKEVTKEELDSLTLQHVAVANKSGNYEGICLWFTCTFPCCVKEPVILSTGPEELKTHWKQTCIVLPDALAVEESEPIAYNISINRAQKNARRYNIEMEMLNPNEIEHPEYCFCHLTKCILKRALLDQYDRQPETG